jgi:hypothetical protein
LSYQAIFFTMLPSMTIVSAGSKIELAGLPLKSMLTSGSSS